MGRAGRGGRTRDLDAIDWTVSGHVVEGMMLGIQGVCGSSREGRGRLSEETKNGRVGRDDRISRKETERRKTGERRGLAEAWLG